MNKDARPLQPASTAGLGGVPSFRCGTVRTALLSWPLLPSWVLAVSIGFLFAGGYGLTRSLQGSHRASIPTKNPATADAGLMVDVNAAASSAAESLPAETQTIDPPVVESPPDVPPIVPDALPEVVPQLALEDLFTVPAAPEIEEPLTPDTPRPQPSPRQPTATPRSAATTASPAPQTSSQKGGTGGTTTGGSGSSSGGTSSGTFPAPPYPSFARSRRMQGTVYLSIQVSSTGQVSSVQVARSSGYSDLDRYASDWVKSRWTWSTGKGGSYRQPVVFRLR